MNAKRTNKILFLDRDGTINIDLGPQYLNDPAHAKLIPGVSTALVLAKKHGFKIAIITNQAGVAKGRTPIEALDKIHQRLCDLITEEAKLTTPFVFDDIRYCPHHPDEKCRCRKPEVKMLQDSLEALNGSVEESYFIGDKISDLLCGNRMSMKSILVLTGHGLESQAELKLSRLVEPVFVAKALDQAIEFIIGETSQNGIK